MRSSENPRLHHGPLIHCLVADVRFPLTLPPPTYLPSILNIDRVSPYSSVSAEMFEKMQKAWRQTMGSRKETEQEHTVFLYRVEPFLIFVIWSSAI